VVLWLGTDTEKEILNGMIKKGRLMPPLG